MSTENLTGIPTDAILGALGALGSVVYWDVIRRLDSLQKDGERRSRIIEHIRSYHRLICAKLGIDYSDPPEK